MNSYTERDAHAIAAMHLSTTATRTFAITIVADNLVWRIDIDNMTVGALLALTTIDYHSKHLRLRGRKKEAIKNTPATLTIAKEFGPATPIATLDELKTLQHDHPNCNYGNVAEQLVRRSFGLDMYWHRDSVPHWVAGDMVVNGKHIQHKHQNATFVDGKHYGF